MTNEQEQLDCASKYRRYIRDRLDALLDDQYISPTEFILETARAWHECEKELLAIQRKYHMATEL